MEPPRIAPLSVEGKVRVEKVLDKALTNIEFREHLLDDPWAALNETDLTPDEKKMMFTLHRVALEEWGIDVRRFRSFLRDNGFKLSPVMKSEK